MSQGPKDRVWSIQKGVYEDGTPESDQDFRARVRAKLLDVEATGEMIGGAFYLRPTREEVAPGMWETVAWQIMWVGEAAARRAMGEFDKPRVSPDEVDTDPVLVAVGAPEDDPEPGAA